MMMEMKSLDYLVPQPVAVNLRGRDVMFDPIRLSDITALAALVHNERRSIVEANLDKLGGTPEQRAHLLWAVNAGNVEDMFRDEIRKPDRLVWLLQRCFKRCNPDVQWDIADALSLGEVKTVFEALGAASGLLVNPTPEEGEKAETS